MAQKVFHFYRKSVYGTPLIYPLEPEFLFAHNLISGRKTLTNQDFEGYERLGIKLKEGKAPVDAPSESK